MREKILIRAFVDTEVWSIAKKRPAMEKFRSKEDYERAFRLHESCKRFFEEEFEKLRTYMALHQVAEIFHVLAFRGYRVPLDEALRIVVGIMEDDGIVKIPTSLGHVKESVEACKETGIHVWDFLCFIPVKNYVNVVYSLDKHFLTIGKKYNVKVVNPAEEWLEI
ncbi:MAG: hypothetical protein QXN15_10880 [Candidatus Jordarchaeales archaeon]|nr:hypothetical protein [Candidatus Jordarchaeia archaeon]